MSFVEVVSQTWEEERHEKHVAEPAMPVTIMNSVFPYNPNFMFVFLSQRKAF